jgi:hypothetical protein
MIRSKYIDKKWYKPNEQLGVKGNNQQVTPLEKKNSEASNNVIFTMESAKVTSLEPPTQSLGRKKLDSFKEVDGQKNFFMAQQQNNTPQLFQDLNKQTPNVTFQQYENPLTNIKKPGTVEAISIAKERPVDKYDAFREAVDLNSPAPDKGSFSFNHNAFKSHGASYPVNQSNLGNVSFGQGGVRGPPSKNQPHESSANANTAFGFTPVNTNSEDAPSYKGNYSNRIFDATTGVHCVYPSAQVSLNNNQTKSDFEPASIFDFRANQTNQNFYDNLTQRPFEAQTTFPKDVNEKKSKNPFEKSNFGSVNHGNEYGNNITFQNQIPYQQMQGFNTQGFQNSPMEVHQRAISGNTQNGFVESPQFPFGQNRSNKEVPINNNQNYAAVSDPFAFLSNTTKTAPRASLQLTPNQASSYSKPNAFNTTPTDLLG